MKKNTYKSFTRAMNLNNRGAVLISVYMVLFVLIALSSSVARLNFSELRDALRYKNSVAAFWLAEAGINKFLAAPDMLDEVESYVNTEEDETFELNRDDSDPRYRVIRSIGTVDGIQRTIQIKYPALSRVFERTLSTPGNLTIEGRKSSVTVNDRLRLGGRVVNTSVYPLTFFEDKQEDVNEELVSIKYPDANNNGTPDEFEDFVTFNRNLIARYAQEEVVYVKGNETYTIVPDEALKGKKIVYIEGDQAGEGNVIIQFGSVLPKGQNLTIISTGSVTHNQVGEAHKDSQLNIIAWSDYFETAALPSIHQGMIYTHGTAYFDEVHDTSVTNGSVVANEGIVFKEIWSTKTFNYADVRTRGAVPPGFEGLSGGGVSGYMPLPNSWREI